MTHLTRKDFHALLIELRKNVANGSHDYAYGICFNITKLIMAANIMTGESAYNAAMNMSSKYAKGWSEHSGTPILPVPFPYHTYIPKWAAEQGDSRKRLLNYLIRNTR